MTCLAATMLLAAPAQTLAKDANLTDEEKRHHKI
jgi:hypothetical protein